MKRKKLQAGKTAGPDSDSRKRRLNCYENGKRSRCFRTQFPLEIQDNWRHGTSYNLPIDELMEVFDNAINTGYTIAWGSDVSESGFTRDGVAVMPDDDKIQELSGSDMVGRSRMLLFLGWG